MYNYIPLFVFSPSQGVCCSKRCQYLGNKTQLVCKPAGECTKLSVCSENNAQCPESQHKANFTLCSQNTQYCLNGVCYI